MAGEIEQLGKYQVERGNYDPQVCWALYGDMGYDGRDALIVLARHQEARRLAEQCMAWLKEVERTHGRAWHATQEQRAAHPLINVLPLEHPAHDMSHFGQYSSYYVERVYFRW